VILAPPCIYLHPFMFMIKLIQCPKSHLTKTVKWENDLREATFMTSVLLPVADQPIKKGGILMAINFLTHSGTIILCCH